MRLLPLNASKHIHNKKEKTNKMDKWHMLGRPRNRGSPNQTTSKKRIHNRKKNKINHLH